uniref:CSF2R factor n=1 Tax=Mesocestoides corti TaxID=53468 RepID=A0A5K3G0G4_MESCO
LQCNASTEHTPWQVLVFSWQPRTGDHSPACTCPCNWGLIGACFQVGLAVRTHCSAPHEFVIKSLESEFAKDSKVLGSFVYGINSSQDNTFQSR